jgi:hypothetical protein
MTSQSPLTRSPFSIQKEICRSLSLTTPVSRRLCRIPALSFHSLSPLSILVQVLDQFHTSSSLATSKPPNNKVSGKVKGRIVNNMQNGCLGCSPSPPGHDQGIQKFSSERLKTRDSDKGLSSCQALPGLGQRIP